MLGCFIRRLTPDGLFAVDYDADSLAEAAQHESKDGIYTVANTFNTFQTLKLDAHLDRLEDSAKRSDLPLALDRTRLKIALRQMIAEAQMGSVRFRITFGRNQPDVFIISLEPFHPPSSELLANGVKVMTVPDSARQNAAAKTTGWMHRRKSIAEALGKDIDEAILLDEDGYLLEGLGSNFYAILNGELRTAGEGVLYGISQQIVFKTAPSIVPIRREAVHLDDVPQLSEAIITSSSRGIIPVVCIDELMIGDGKPGAITMRLRDVYEQWVADHLETLPEGTL